MIRISAFLLVAISLVVVEASAQKQNLSIQGVLRDANGASVPNASYSLIFRLYTVSTGGSHVWTETQSLSVVNGVYSTTLGKVTSLAGLDYNLQYWLGISINAQAEMTPRTEMTLSPYAILGGVAGITNVVPQSGNVGIGTVTPAYKLHVIGDGYFNKSVYLSRDNTTGGGIVFSDDGDIIDFNDGFATHRFSYGLRLTNGNKSGTTAIQLGSSAGGTTFFNSGNVGFGTALPAARLQVGSSFLKIFDNNASATDMNYFRGTSNHLVVNANGALYLNYPEGNAGQTRIGEALFVGRAGNVGVGIDNPWLRFQVNGDVSMTGGYIYANNTVDNSSGNFGIGGTVYSNVKLTVSSNQTYAGFFDGPLYAKSMSKGSGSFKIDHPLDPANKFLYHSFVESPDMMNVYNGNVTTDGDGRATVTLPTYFEALNRDYRYQLTAIGQFAQAMVESEVSNNRFVIRTDKPNVKVSWQVTGIRQDALAKAHPIVPEVDKSAEERGKYLNPEELNMPASARLLPGAPVKAPEPVKPGQ